MYKISRFSYIIKYNMKNTYTVKILWINSHTVTGHLKKKAIFIIEYLCKAYISITMDILKELKK